ncbi:unnamed protein product [Symbiodinium pilosum]|uniref:Uncharacterized protein n=1 Tax=Symbiodinium pilosum TaxID=2952 RepID=A0A812JQJ5_SYMPI|nr:unnamed protein product [Symbiodinium pilosum]
MDGMIPTAGKEGYGVVPGSAEAGLDVQTVYEWEYLGEPLFVFAYTAMVVGRQCLALSLIALQVFSTRIQKMLQADAKDFLMQCDPASIGLAQSYVCEASKAFVRCFPPVSIIVALVVASQLILCQRLFYLMIRHGVLVDFQNLAPYKDPMFWWVVITCVLALCHFIFHMVVAEQQDMEVHDLKAVIDAVFFGLPALFYIIFLYMSYDVEWLLLPLSKFWEEDPEWALKTSSELVSWLNLDARATGPLHPESCCQVFIKDMAESMCIAAQMAPGYQAGGLDERATTAATAIKRQGLIQRAWIVELLMDYRMADDKSRHFRVAWSLWIFITALICFAAVALLALQIAKDVEDIVRGQHAEILGTVVTGVNVLCMVSVILIFLYDAWPSRSTSV